MNREFEIIDKLIEFVESNSEFYEKYPYWKDITMAAVNKIILKLLNNISNTVQYNNMKISELINILNEYKDKHGDIEVYIGTIFNGCKMIRNPHIKYEGDCDSVIIK